MYDGKGKALVRMAGGDEAIVGEPRALKACSPGSSAPPLSVDRVLLPPSPLDGAGRSARRGGNRVRARPVRRPFRGAAGRRSSPRPASLPSRASSSRTARGTARTPVRWPRRSARASWTRSAPAYSRVWGSGFSQTPVLTCRPAVSRTSSRYSSRARFRSGCSMPGTRPVSRNPGAGLLPADAR